MATEQVFKSEEEAQKVIDGTDWNLVAALIYACKEADQYEKNTDELLLIVRDASGKEIFRHATKKGSYGMISIRKCSCNSAYQDEQYGRQMRLFNRGDKTLTCTVCGATQPADTLSKKELAEQKK